MGTERMDVVEREAAGVKRRGGSELARSGPKLGEALPLQARLLLSLQQSAGNRAVFGLVQRLRKAPKEEGQMKEASHRAFESGPPAPRNDTGLPDGLKSGIEFLSGISLDDVNVRYDSDQPAQVDALAYARGTDIHVAPGQEHHLAHEAWHVVQQAQGRVQPTMHLPGGIPVNDDKALEQEADAMGAKALAKTAQRRDAPQAQELLQGKFAPGLSRRAAIAGSGVVQRETFIGARNWHHMHIDIAQPHYKIGNSQASRINIGGAGNQDYRKADLEAVIEAVKGRLTEPGAQACYDWCIAQARRLKAEARA